MATAREITVVALSQVGVTEYPESSNRVKYNEAYYGSSVSGADYPWCVVFVWWVFREAGAPELFYGGGKTASSNTLKNFYSRNGHIVESGYMPGDIAFMGFGSPSIEHTGLITGINADGSISTVEGNTSTSSNDNGGSVMRRTRKLSDIVCAARPDYSQEQEDTEVRYSYLADIPNDFGFQDIINTLMDAEIIKGDGSDPGGNGDLIDLSHDQVRSLVFEYRGGAFDRKLMSMGMQPAVDV